MFYKFYILLFSLVDINYAECDFFYIVDLQAVFGLIQTTVKVEIFAVH